MSYRVWFHKIGHSIGFLVVILKISRVVYSTKNEKKVVWVDRSEFRVFRSLAACRINSDSDIVQIFSLRLLIGQNFEMSRQDFLAPDRSRSSSPSRSRFSRSTVWFLVVLSVLLSVIWMFCHFSGFIKIELNKLTI